MDLYVVGASGLAREMYYLASVLHDLGRLSARPAGFVDADTERSELRSTALIGEVELLSDDELLARPQVVALVHGIGFPRPRLAIAERYATRPDTSWPTLVHPTASLDGPVELAPGVAIAANCSLTGDIAIGPGALLNLNVTIGHDTTIGAGSVLNPGANVSGGVRLGRGVLVGTGATILQNLEIGDGAIVGAGSLVTRDVAPGTTVVGVPARPR
jgi:sugar O-acyltransferase (sialic acid O-acetyltransferase NeuD family)